MVGITYLQYKYRCAFRAKMHFISLHKGFNHRDNKTDQFLYEQELNRLNAKITHLYDLLHNVEPLPQKPKGRVFKFWRVKILWYQ